MVEDSESNGRFANPTGTDQSNCIEVLDKIKDALDQIVATETSLRRRRRQFSE